MSYPVPNWDGMVRAVDAKFVEVLRRPLPALALFAGKEFRVSDLGIRTLEWKKISDDLAGAVISMDIPALSPDRGGTTDDSIQIPVFTKDLHYDERDYAAATRSGMDTVAAERASYAMAIEVNKYLLKGRTGGPGAAISILNHPDLLTHDATGGNFENAADVSKHLNKAIAKLLDKQHMGPFTLLMHPLDQDLWGNFIGQTSVTLRDALPPLVNGVLYDKDGAAQGEMYLIEPSSVNYDVVTPVGLGNVQRRVKVDPIMGSVDVRFLTALVPRVKHGDGVCRIDFDRA